MLKVRELKKNYGKVTAVDNISFDINSGEVCVLLGPNGAGKSTTIKSISGLVRFKGSIEIGGHPVTAKEARRIFGYIPETPSLYELLTIDEHLDFIASAYGVKDYHEKREELFDRFDLLDKRDKVGKELSKGMQQKVSICCGLITNPQLIMFDEPMVGLDPKAIKELKKIFRELKDKGCGILISTHMIDTIEELWDRVLIMKESQIVKSITKDELVSTGKTLEDIFFEVTGVEK